MPARMDFWSRRPRVGGRHGSWPGSLVVRPEYNPFAGGRRGGGMLRRREKRSRAVDARRVPAGHAEPSPPCAFLRRLREGAARWLVILPRGGSAFKEAPRETLNNSHGALVFSRARRQGAARSQWPSPLARDATPTAGTAEDPDGRAMRSQWTVLAFLPRATAIDCERRLATANAWLRRAPCELFSVSLSRHPHGRQLQCLSSIPPVPDRDGAGTRQTAPGRPDFQRGGMT